MRHAQIHEGTASMQDNREPAKTQKRRVYQAPELKKQPSLKEITLFTSFGPPS
jgi:hypothetical protein